MEKNNELIFFRGDFCSYFNLYAVFLSTLLQKIVPEFDLLSPNPEIGYNFFTDLRTLYSIQNYF